MYQNSNSEVIVVDKIEQIADQCRSSSAAVHHPRIAVLHISLKLQCCISA